MHTPIIIHNFLSSTACENLIDLGNSRRQILDRFGRRGKGRNSYKAKLDSNNSKIILNLVRPHIKYPFKLNGKDPIVEFLTYGPKQYTGWHTDEYEIRSNTEKKVSMIILLSDHKDFSGGDLEFAYYLQPKKRFNKQGTLILFPSYMFHRVTAVKHGTRHTLLSFFEGPGFV